MAFDVLVNLPCRLFNVSACICVLYAMEKLNLDFAFLQDKL